MHRADASIPPVSRPEQPVMREIVRERPVSRPVHRPVITGWFYAAALSLGQFICFCTIRFRVIRPEIPDHAGGYLLALTHLGHVDPFLASVLVRRRINWMTRREFFAWRPIAFLLRKLGAFSVNRQGIPVSAVRAAIALAKDGRVVGICPEGGRTRGSSAAVHGATVKRGVASIAIRSGAPIIPCVMLGTAALSHVGPWLPAKRGRVWVAFGEPIQPPTGPSTRAKRDALRDQLCSAYVELYTELRRQFALTDADIE